MYSLPSHFRPTSHSPLPVQIIRRNPQSPLFLLNLPILVMFPFPAHSSPRNPPTAPKKRSCVPLPVTPSTPSRTLNDRDNLEGSRSSTHAAGPQEISHSFDSFNSDTSTKKPLTDQNTPKGASLFESRTLPPPDAHSVPFPQDCPLLNPIEWLTPSRRGGEARHRDHTPQDGSSPTRPIFSSPTRPAFSSPTRSIFSSPTHPIFSSPTRPVFSSPTRTVLWSRPISLPPIRLVSFPPIHPPFSPPIAGSTCDAGDMRMVTRLRTTSDGDAPNKLQSCSQRQSTVPPAPSDPLTSLSPQTESASPVRPRRVHNPRPRPSFPKSGSKVKCGWAGCDAQLSYTKAAISDHINTVHRGEDESVTCQWKVPEQGICGRSLARDYLRKHTLNLHTMLTTVSCEWCGESQRSYVLSRHKKVCNARPEGLPK